MPLKLRIVVALWILATMSQLIAGRLVDPAINAALLYGMFRGSEGVRVFVRGLTAFAFLLFALVLGGCLLAFASEPSAEHALISVIFGVATAIYGFTLWALGSRDVQRWMFARSAGIPVEEVPVT